MKIKLIGIIMICLLSLTVTIAAQVSTWPNTKNTQINATITCREPQTLFACECKGEITEKDISLKYSFVNWTDGKMTYLNYSATMGVGGYCVQGLKGDNLVFIDPHDTIVDDIWTKVNNEYLANKQAVTKKEPTGSGEIVIKR